MALLPSSFRTPLHLHCITHTPLVTPPHGTSATPPLMHFLSHPCTPFQAESKAEAVAAFKRARTTLDTLKASQTQIDAVKAITNLEALMGTYGTELVGTVSDWTSWLGAFGLSVNPDGSSNGGSSSPPSSASGVVELQTLIGYLKTLDMLASIGLPYGQGALASFGGQTGVAALEAALGKMTTKADLAALLSAFGFSGILDKLGARMDSFPYGTYVGSVKTLGDLISLLEGIASYSQTGVLPNLPVS